MSRVPERFENVALAEAVGSRLEPDVAGSALQADAVVVNPGTGRGAVLPLRYLAAQRAATGKPMSPGPVAIGAPARAPDQTTVEAVRTLDGSAADEPAAVRRAVELLGQGLPPGAGIDVLRLNPDMREGVAAAVEAIR